MACNCQHVISQREQLSEITLMLFPAKSHRFRQRKLSTMVCALWDGPRSKCTRCRAPRWTGKTDSCFCGFLSNCADAILERFYDVISWYFHLEWEYAGFVGGGATVGHTDLLCCLLEFSWEENKYETGFNFLEVVRKVRWCGCLCNVSHYQELFIKKISRHKIGVDPPPP